MLYEVSTRRKIIQRFFHLQINKTMLESWMSVGHQGVFWLWQLLYCLCWTANSTCGVHVHDVFDDFSCGKQWKQPISHSFSEFQGWSSSSLKSFQDAKILDHFQWDIDCISPSLCLHQFPIGRSRLWTIAIHRHRECSDCWYVFYFWSNETLSRIQLLGCTLIMTGIALMFLEVSGPVSSNFPSSFLWISISTLFYASSIITIRFAGAEELPERPKSVAIVLSSGLLGFLFLRIFLCKESLTFHPEIQLWAFLNAVASMTGLLSVVLSYEVPGAKVALATALIDSNAVPMCVLNFIILGEKPGMSKLIGMAVVLLGCAAGFLSPEAECNELADSLLGA